MKHPLDILILGVQVPFTRGGAEALIDRLRRELELRGHTVDLVQLPFAANPKSSLVREMSLWRMLNLRSYAGRNVDLVIPTKFPSYLAIHPRKVLWLVHQHRQVYELYDTRFGDFDPTPEDETVRRMVHEADLVALKECVARYTIAQNVCDRLQTFLGLSSEALLPPTPLCGRYRSGEKGDYILSVGRLCSIKRTDLIVRAMASTTRSLRLKIVGAADEPAMEEYLRSEVRKHHLEDRVEFLGRVSDDELVNLYAGAFAVYYAPHNEDYGFVTLEARASGKPVITGLDSGTVRDFIVNERNGLVVEPTESAIGGALNRLFEDDQLYSRIAVSDDISQMTASWEQIVERLTAPAYEGHESALNPAHLAAESLDGEDQAEKQVMEETIGQAPGQKRLATG